MTSKDRIQAAALRLFARHGFEGVGLQRIADEVGLHKSSLFHHYKGKVELANEVFQIALHEVVDLVRPLAADPPALDGLLAVVDGLVDYLSDHPDAARLFLQGMAGSRIPVAVAHGEGRAAFGSASDQAGAHIALRYVEGDGGSATTYPANPNGSPDAIAGLTSSDGRATILMPHPERTLRVANYSWAPREWEGDAPWLRMFRNARAWVG